MKLKNQFNVFIEGLAKTRLRGNAFNQYSYDDGENSIRKQNLVLYLQQMAEFDPSMLLVGEAPGYRGCRLTGGATFAIARKAGKEAEIIGMDLSSSQEEVARKRNPFENIRFIGGEVAKKVQSITEHFK